MYKHKIILWLCLCFISNVTMAAFSKSIWSKWVKHNPCSQEIISHQEWQNFLRKHVVTNSEGIHLIDYPNLSKKDFNTVSEYISRLSHISIESYNRNEQLAYWINLYNALTVQLIIENYPIDSIQQINISPGLFSIGPWGAPIVNIATIPLSLDDIHNRIIRPIWNDPRTHYAINDATIGGANISNQAFDGKHIDQQLTKASFDYINSLRGVQLIEGKLILSKIYEWYVDDFGENDMDIIHHLMIYANEPLRKDLEHMTSINSYIYNWHLNTTISPTQ